MLVNDDLTDAEWHRRISIIMDMLLVITLYIPNIKATGFPVEFNYEESQLGTTVLSEKTARRAHGSGHLMVRQ